MEPLVIFCAGLVVYCGYLAILDAAKSWRVARVETVPKRTPAKKRRAKAGSRRQQRPAAGIPICRPLLQKV
jgi:hypothetical protein